MSSDVFGRISDNEAFKDKVYEIIASNYQDPLFGLDALAEKLGVTNSILHSRLKTATEKTPGDMLREVRLSKAMELLKSNIHLNTSEVAAACGFASLNSFSSTFKKYFEKTPSMARSEAINARR
jgi:transcriptional regulator GlxA family with amidase domain